MIYKKIILDCYKFNPTQMKRVCDELSKVKIKFKWIPQTLYDCVWIMIKIEKDEIIPVEFKKITKNCTKEEYEHWCN